MVELAHESLRRWPALATWLRERGPHLRTRRELDDALARWLASGEYDQELILPGSRLREAEDLLRAAPDLVADPALRTFVEGSLDRAARIDREAQDTLRREALRLTQLAEEQTKAGDAVTRCSSGSRPWTGSSWFATTPRSPRQLRHSTSSIGSARKAAPVRP